MFSSPLPQTKEAMILSKYDSNMTLNLIPQNTCFYGFLSSIWFLQFMSHKSKNEFTQLYTKFWVKLTKFLASKFISLLLRSETSTAKLPALFQRDKTSVRSIGKYKIIR